MTNDQTAKMPEPGWCTPAELSRVIDGDTVELIVHRKIRVRLLDYSAPEIRTRDLVEKAAGLEAKTRLEDLIRQHGGKLLLFVPTGPDQELVDVFSFGRVLGRLWLPDGREISQVMVAASHATTATRKPADRI